MNYNYHTHTYRCRHATGTEEEYITRAIENGIKYMGFSDHVPLTFNDGTESGFRVPVCNGKEYVETLNTLKEKYKDKIEIKIGFEMEYYPEYFEQTLKNAIEYGAEYLILGQHFMGPENEGAHHSAKKTDDEGLLKSFVDILTEAMSKRVFSYVAHPDMFNFIGDENVYRKEIVRLCIASKKYNTPLEINFLGIRDSRHYPRETFWEIVAQEQAPVTFGFDAHTVESAYDGESIAKAKAIVEKYGLNYIGKPNIIDIRCYK